MDFPSIDAWCVLMNFYVLFVRILKQQQKWNKRKIKTKKKVRGKFPISIVKRKVSVKIFYVNHNTGVNWVSNREKTVYE